MEIINGIEQNGAAIGLDIDGATIDDSVIGGTTPAAGSFTTIEAFTDPVDADGVGDRGFNDARYALESNNLSDLASAVTAFGNIKQAATESATGVLEKATTGEVVIGTDTDRAVTPVGITARMEDPGPIGGVTPASGNFTTGNFTGQLDGALLNNQMVQKVTFDILGLMTDPRFLNLLCEDPGAGTMTDVSGQGHDGTYQGSMTSGDRFKKGMGWALDFDGTDDYVDFGDDDNFSFGDGANDEAVTFFGVIEVIESALTQIIISKWDAHSTGESREWIIEFLASRIFRIYQYDESANVSCNRYTDAALSVGWHSYAITSPGDGGATAMNNVKIYIDGVSVSTTHNNDASYVAMENLSSIVMIGAMENSSGVIDKFMDGDSALIGIDGSEWSAFNVHRFHQLIKGLYGL